MILTCGCEVTVTAPARIERACEQHGRMSLRDHFAGQALIGQIHEVVSEGGQWNPAACAALAYEFADAMIAAREGK